MKRLLMTLYVVVAVVMAVATILEKMYGTDFAAANIYGSWWFSTVWAMLTASGIAWIIRRRMRRWHLIALHVSFVIILAGALLTHVTSETGYVHLRIGNATSSFISKDNGGTESEHRLPFSLRLERFEVSYHDGTMTAADYTSYLTVTDAGQSFPVQLSMNRIFSRHSYRFIQNSYDEDMKGSFISVSHDPYGLPLTYTGYALLFISMLWLLITPRGTFRSLLRSQFMRSASVALLLLTVSMAAMSAERVPKPVADEFGSVLVNYNDRICPMQTFALDVMKKVHGSRTYNGMTAEQVLLSYVFYTPDWDAEPLIRVKSGELREYLGIDKYASVNSFFSAEGYRLGALLYEHYREGNNDALHKAAADINDRLELIMQIKQGLPFRVFPVNDVHRTRWLCPADTLPATTHYDDALFIRNAIPMVYQNITTGNSEGAIKTLRNLKDYQLRHGGTSVPSQTKIKAEHVYNSIPLATILFMVNLTLGFICFFVRKHGIIFRGLLALSFLCLTSILVLRWIISGTIPMSNGYETMLITAWLVMLITLLIPMRRGDDLPQFPILHIAFGFLLSGFFLLVSHIGQMDPQIGRLMPVLNSPLLSVHVSIIMISYALLSITFICGLTSLVMFRNRALALSLGNLSRLLLYPAIVCLSLGIFIGAIWANISWGQYWSWDPKETWALITLMAYAVPLHRESLPQMRRPLMYHAYMTLAFLTILMTYFGVNYVLGGMHSYA